jgi:hypothetical protein
MFKRANTAERITLGRIATQKSSVQTVRGDCVVYSNGDSFCAKMKDKGDSLKGDSSVPTTDNILTVTIAVADLEQPTLLV